MGEAPVSQHRLPALPGEGLTRPSLRQFLAARTCEFDRLPRLSGVKEQDPAAGGGPRVRSGGDDRRVGYVTVGNRHLGALI
jgi:hypothetical protein